MPLVRENSIESVETCGAEGVVLKLRRRFTSDASPGRAFRQAAEGAARMTASTVYKIAPDALWRAAERAGRFDGAPVDVADGYIHLSTAEQARETAAKHFAGQADLVLIAVDAAALGAALRWEPSRGGALFPHLYAPLPLSAVAWTAPLPLGADGAHAFPEALA